jgi:hypothetical protein
MEEGSSRQQGRGHEHPPGKRQQDARADDAIGQGPARQLVGEHARGGTADPDERVDDSGEPGRRVGQGGRHRRLYRAEHQADGRRDRDPRGEQPWPGEPAPHARHAGLGTPVEQREPQLAAHQQHEGDAERHDRGHHGGQRRAEHGTRHVGDLVRDGLIAHRHLDAVTSVRMAGEPGRPRGAGQRAHLGVGRPHQGGQRERHPERGGPEEQTDQPEQAQGTGDGDDDEGAAVADPVGEGPHQRGPDDTPETERPDEQARGGEGTGEHLTADEHGEGKHGDGEPGKEGQQHPGGPGRGDEQGKGTLTGHRDVGGSRRGRHGIEGGVGLGIRRGHGYLRAR